MTPRASVVIPAHDEATALPGLLGRLAAAGPGAFEIVVVANGCADATAQVARAAGAHVVEIPEPSKAAALAAGDAVAVAFPRVYLDADVVVDADALLALAAALRARPGPAVGAPTLRVDASEASWAVRQHYRVWALTDYRRGGHVGSGVYAVNAAGRARWGAFPDVVADDRFVQQRFALAERVTLPDHAFTVQAPRTVPALMRRATRIHRGNQELVARGLASSPPEPVGAAAAGRSPGRSSGRSPGRSQVALLARVGRRPALWPALAVYCVTYGAPALRARVDARRGAPIAWAGRETARA
ncbi:glycosyltransferase [Xylanimonas ulmi]|uniref:4,4'-diaponeurosporenoate glycosyltransferase n=1 Tax=Xylanimonas ulmi TaxID=228973 RepID=A0A4Q7M6B2_9MICO|nr:glycosyltransferase [Xylanibacterium ulmi]RZS62613.1 glycosyl transferase family 2 [Xylanibacterium ulmi]